jgi:hypothetical protein
MNIYTGIYSMGCYESIFIKYRIMEFFDGKIFWKSMDIFTESKGKTEVK